jgi:hypothetical protein
MFSVIRNCNGHGTEKMIPFQATFNKHKTKKEKALLSLLLVGLRDFPFM